MATIQVSLLEYFSDSENFTLKEAERVVQDVLNLDVKEPSIRARIYEGIDKGLFTKISRGVYKTTKNGCECLLINGDGRNLSMIPSNSIDAIITDHAPHAKEEKEQGLEKAPNGIVGFETALSATITNLVDKGYISYLDMVKLTSYNPAKILGIDRGTIEKGKIADITIFDPNKEYVYTEEMIVSKSKNTPYIGKTLKGKVMYTIVGGRIVYEECNG